MTIYRIDIRRHGRLLGHFESGTPWSLEAARDIAATLGKADGYQLTFALARDERRLVESGPNGMRLVSSEPLFVATTLEG
ncbi:cytoplasmic protein [Massilia sp. CFBP9012]|uniref:cytoplasmic protein n=1 Tax=Massilia sp. CFBP9012 TaxID=3096531 RepID=UPI002A6994D0|nr:cytoplasmic protein [Massilia sp. CFBP9012]MDY0976186.1 cytoplasmic protein [Massilia sp. CFBP9012]